MRVFLSLFPCIVFMMLSACGGGGGSSATTTTPVATTPTYPTSTTPIPVLASSYLNKIAAGNTIGSIALPSEVSAGNAVAFADFFQDGHYSMVTHSLEYKVGNTSTYSNYGHIHFYRLNSAGVWVDNTAQLLTNNVGCLHPRKAVVGDFNGDGKPDVFFACHGVDASPFPGEQPHYLLSKADGTYQNVTLPVTCFCHSATVGTLNATGYADVVVVDNVVNQQPFLLKNNGASGGFTKTSLGLSSTQYKEIFTTEILPINGSSLFLGGNGADPNYPAGVFPPTLFPSIAGGFTETGKTVIPVNSNYQLPLDVLVNGNNLYLLNVQLTWTSAVYGPSDIDRVNLSTLAATSIYTGPASFSTGTTWINWINFYGSNVVSMDSIYGVSVPK